MSKINMLRDRILVRPKAVETKTESGFVIPEEAKAIPSSGHVVAVGPNAIVKESDFVIYQAGAGMPLEYEGEDLIIMRDMDVHCTL